MSHLCSGIASKISPSIWPRARATMTSVCRTSLLRGIRRTVFVHIYLVNPIENLAAGGTSYVDSDPELASFVQWYYTSDANGRACLHELGHLMSLDHVDVDYPDERQAALRNNLMTKGLSVGRDLTLKQINKVKSSKLVRRYGA